MSCRRKLSALITAYDSVPALWELIRKAIEARYAKASSLTRALFWSSLWIKDKMLFYGIPGTWCLDTLIFNDIKTITGGDLFWSVCGGSSLSEETQRFVRAVICPMGMAYGLTESGAYIFPFPA